MDQIHSNGAFDNIVLPRSLAASQAGAYHRMSTADLHHHSEALERIVAV